MSSYSYDPVASMPTASDAGQIAADVATKKAKSEIKKKKGTPQQQAERATERMARRQMAAEGRSSTIATTPVGLPGQGEGERKTLLGR